MLIIQRNNLLILLWKKIWKLRINTLRPKTMWRNRATSVKKKNYWNTITGEYTHYISLST